MKNEKLENDLKRNQKNIEVIDEAVQSFKKIVDAGIDDGELSRRIKGSLMGVSGIRGEREQEVARLRRRLKAE